MSEISFKAIIAEMKRVQGVPIENDNRIMQCPDTLRIVGFTEIANIKQITEICEFSVRDAWISRGRPAAHVSHAIHGILACSLSFSVEPVINDPVYEGRKVSYIRVVSESAAQEHKSPIMLRDMLLKRLSKDELSDLVAAFSDGSLDSVFYGQVFDGGEIEVEEFQGLIAMDAENFPSKYL